jgi:hypothetical protein
MNLALILFLAFSLTSCATFSHSSVKTIAFSDIEKLVPGKTTKDQVHTLFGKPVKLSPRSETQEAWIYDEMLSTGAIGQKAAFSFDDDILVGALWIPYESDPLENAQAVQEHFKGAKFIRKIKGWDKLGHSYSEDASYYDPERGILFTTSGRDQLVSAIGFNLPDAKRSVSSEKIK